MAREQSLQRARTPTEQLLAQAKDAQARQEAERLRNRTWPQRAAAPRTVGTGIMRPASSPFGRPSMARPGASRSFSSQSTHPALLQLMQQHPDVFSRIDTTLKKAYILCDKEQSSNFMGRLWGTITDTPTTILMKTLFKKAGEDQIYIRKGVMSEDINEEILGMGALITIIKDHVRDGTPFPHLYNPTPSQKLFLNSISYDPKATIDILAAYAYTAGHPEPTQSRQKQSRIALHNELLKAIQYNNMAEAERLIKAGADVNATNQTTGQVALVQVAKSPVAAYVNGREKSAIKWTQLLLELGANPNAVDGTGTTPLMALAYSASPKSSMVTNEAVNVAALLIEAGADINYTNQEISIFDEAVASRNKDVVRLLMDDSRLKVDFAGKQGKNLLFSAVKNNDSMMAELLLEKGAPVNSEIRSRVSPLHIAAIRGNKEMVKLLLEYGANSKAKDLYGYTPDVYAHLAGIHIYKAEHDSWRRQVIYDWRKYADPLSYNDVRVILDMLQNVRQKDKQQTATADNATEAAQNESDKVILKYINNINKTNKEKGSSFQELVLEYHPDVTKNDPQKQAVMIRINALRDIQKEFAQDLAEYHDKKMNLSTLKTKYNPARTKNDTVLKELYKELSKQIPD